MAQILLLLAAAVLLCVSAVLFFRARNTHDRLDNMIDCAIRGEFQPTRYDESQISRTEQKLAQYLSASVLSRTALDEDRARIQSLIGDISHQTRMPIANILLYTSLLDEEPLTDEQHALAKQACQQAEKLRFLIDSLVKTSIWKPVWCRCIRSQARSHPCWIRSIRPICQRRRTKTSR